MSIFISLFHRVYCSFKQIIKNTKLCQQLMIVGIKRKKNVVVKCLCSLQQLDHHSHENKDYLFIYSKLKFPEFSVD